MLTVAACASASTSTLDTVPDLPDFITLGEIAEAIESLPRAVALQTVPTVNTLGRCEFCDPEDGVDAAVQVAHQSEGATFVYRVAVCPADIRTAVREADAQPRMNRIWVEIPTVVAA